mmetsp:Transcript_127633/g.272134  ORF Transcript_127633/g.272134 Transcript_127633/m.272134 type:complete len:200 (+) Transcript_127633:249-848(+)
MFSDVRTCCDAYPTSTSLCLAWHLAHSTVNLLLAFLYHFSTFASSRGKERLLAVSSGGRLTSGVSAAGSGMGSFGPCCHEVAAAGRAPGNAAATSAQQSAAAAAAAGPRRRKRGEGEGPGRTGAGGGKTTRPRWQAGCARSGAAAPGAATAAVTAPRRATAARAAAAATAQGRALRPADAPRLMARARPLPVLPSSCLS